MFMGLIFMLGCVICGVLKVFGRGRWGGIGGGGMFWCVNYDEIVRFFFDWSLL